MANGNDADVKVGLQVVGDASGAVPVDQAIKDVGNTAKQVAQETGETQKTVVEQIKAEAAAVTTSTEQVKAAADKAAAGVKTIREELEKKPSPAVSDAIGDLDKKTSLLTDEKKKAAVAGFARSLESLAKGDIAGGMRGISESLFQMSKAIPLPGAAVLFSLALTGVAAAWKAFGPAAKDAGRDLNEFGETLDDEMSRLEAWANSQFDFVNLKTAIADVKSEFDSATKTSNTFRDSVLAAIESRAAGEASGLRQQAAAAREGGDDAGAQVLEEEAARRELIAKIAQERVELEALELQYQLQREKIKMAEESLADLIAKEKEVVAQFDALKAASEKWSGNVDAAFGGDARTRLVSILEKEIAARERRAQQILIEEASIGRRMEGKYIENDRAEIAEIPEIRAFIQELKNAEAIAAAANDALDRQATSYKESKDAILEEGRALTELNTQRIRAAQEYAAVITGVDAQVVSQANITAGEMSRIAESAAAAVETAAQAGTGMVDAVEAFGADMEEKGVEATERISEVKEGLGESMSGLADEAEKGGSEFMAGAAEFRKKMAPAVENLVASISDLMTTSGIVARMSKDLANGQLSISKEVARLNADTKSALSKANLALAQNRNRDS